MIKRLIAWLRRWWRGPKDLKRFNAEVHEMSNVRLTWTLPTPNERQRPIAHVRIEARVSEDLPWSEIAVVDAPAEELVIQDAAPGTWFYMATVVDDRGQESAPAFAEATLDYDAPSALTGFAAAIE